VLEWCQVTVDDLTGMQQQEQQSVFGPTDRRMYAPTPARRPSDLLMAHAVLTLAVNVYGLCGMTHV